MPEFIIALVRASHVYGSACKRMPAREQVKTSISREAKVRIKATKTNSSIFKKSTASPASSGILGLNTGSFLL